MESASFALKMYIGKLQVGDIIFSQIFHRYEIFNHLEAFVFLAGASGHSAKDRGMGFLDLMGVSCPNLCSLPYATLHPWLPRGHIPKPAEAQTLKKEGKDSCIPRHLPRETRVLHYGHRQWKMPSDLEPRDPVVLQPNSTTVAMLPFFHEMLTDGGLDLQEGGRNGEK